jgi:putative heme-binding domain-containing protein
MIYLKAPGAVEQVVAELKDAPSQENQIFYALILRNVTEGWNESLYRDYFGWFNDVQSARGGMSFGGFINNIKNMALGHVSDDMKQKLAKVLEPPKQAEQEQEQRAFVKDWKVEDLLETVSDPNRVPDFEQGKSVFAAAQCYKCHRMGIQGGILGPDLTGAGGRFSPKDLLVAIIEPNTAISDQYGASQFITDEGKVVVGRVVNMSGDSLRIMTNMLDPSSLTGLNRNTILETRASKSSMMPAGLINTFTKEEIADLVAYLRAGGKKGHPIYRNTVADK